jgi:hypothetical protein
MTRRGSDAGSIAPAVPVIGLIILLLGGLVLDASRQLNARGEAVAYAEEAARAGASAVDLAAPRLRLVPADVSARVADYCTSLTSVLHQEGVRDCRLVRVDPVSATDRRRLVVVVHVDMAIQATLLGIVGVSTLTAGGDGRARPLEGVDVGDAN